MAKPRKLATGRWIAQFQRDGVRTSKTFDTKAAADLWQAQQLLADDPHRVGQMTFGELCERWYERYGESRTQAKAERNRINHFKGSALFSTRLKDLNEKTVAAWRDERLKINSAATVLRDWGFFGAICSAAVKEMKLLKVNPFSQTKRPAEPPPRDRLPSDEEMERLRHVAAGRPSFQIALDCFEFSCETGMSLGEVCALNWSQIEARIISLPAFKTRPARKVPMSSRAVEIAGGESGVGPVFGARKGSVDTNWRKLTQMACVEDLHYHDSRHMAATRLAQKLQPLELAKMLGHRDLKMLLKVYFSADAKAVLDKLG